MVSPVILSSFFEKQCTQNHPQYLWGLSRALYPTTFIEIAVYRYSVYPGNKSFIDQACSVKVALIGLVLFCIFIDLSSSIKRKKELGQ